MIRFREAEADDIPVLIALLADDVLAPDWTKADLPRFRTDFDEMREGGTTQLVVAETGDRLVGTFQITILRGVSMKAARRAQVESVRVASDSRGRGIGQAMMDEAERRARAAGCTLMQLMTNSGRDRAHRFYERLGYRATHRAYKKPL